MVATKKEARRQGVTSALKAAPPYCPTCGMNRAFFRFVLYTALAEGFVAALVVSLWIFGGAQLVLP